ncbi:ABC transporter permease [Mucilaginibacter sp. BJC16-A38]|uniref:ABC transporter permease n=1 Tax=Mucilaginibacter phenanthrenivorans TaxID=1234842 RepID=UPI0021575B01|nr:ABC transporter permease [Mucilaginibacter phenanthrenivorans]MCR8556873.1 ABC transporter permease [Mucilaginibacter phenanthrenivorans]
MIKNYFKTAWRNLLSSKFYSAINILGLTIGLTVGLLVLLWVNDELSYDKFNTNAAQIYKVNAQIGTGSSKQVWSGVQSPIATFALKEVPGVVNAVRLTGNWRYSFFRYNNRLLSEEQGKMLFADPSLFKVFDYKLLKGNVENPFPTDNSIIITESTAKRYFGNDNPIGKTLLADNSDNFIVNGVVADFPSNSSIKCNILFSMNVRKNQYGKNDFWKSMDADWGDYYQDTYLQLQPGTSTKTVADKLTQIHIKNQEGTKLSDGHYLLQPLTETHLYAPDGSSSAMQTVRVFAIVAVLILLIAAINYINLSTARAMLRSKEVSVRKIIGAARLQLFSQFIVETILFFGISLILAFILITIAMPFYNTLSGKDMHFDLLSGTVWQVIGATVGLTLIASSIYPALLLSSFKPINALKGKLSMGVGNVVFRKVLVVCQFAFSVGLIIGTLIINRQLTYIQNKELGFDKSFVFSVPMHDMENHYEAAKGELMNQSGIYGVTTGDNSIISLGSTTGDTDWDGKEKDRSFMIHPMAIDEGFIKFFKLKLDGGAGFSGIKPDSAHFILNETAVRDAGIKNPVGKRFKLWGTNGVIIGVLKDFHFASLKQKIEPFIFYYRPHTWQLLVKTTGKDAPKALKTVEAVWKRYNPNYPFTYTFLDQTYEELYKSDERSGTLFSVFAGIAILISCLGLFGLATYTAQVKVKEIGIRKVLGASIANITTMLSKDFLTLIILAIAIATPVAWYAMNNWLQAFVYRATIQWWTFALAGGAAVLIALATISFQAIKAALANPVKSLRSE